SRRRHTRWPRDWSSDVCSSDLPSQPTMDEVIARLSRPTAERIWYIRYAFKIGLNVEDIHRHTRIDPWFLHQIRDIVVTVEDKLRDRKSTRLNSSHVAISYAVFC